MFINLSKKINFPAGTKLHCISWSKALGDIAIGGDDDFLRVIHLNTDTVPVSLTTNVSLPGHSGDVIGVIWNDIHKKLTTFDRNGMIIVWMQTEEGTWYEEMINERKISFLRSIAWDREGKKICIVYEDGYVVVGDVDGERHWGKELWIARIILVEWSPDSKLILLGLINGEIHIYDRFGSFLVEIPHLRCAYGSNVIAGLQWYNGSGGYADPNAPSLAVCLKYGRCQIMTHRSDSNPTFIDTKMMVAQIAWNHNGSILAFAGSHKREEETERFNIIKFYDPYGKHLRTLDVPGEKLTSCSWGPNSEYLALVRDSCCYLASNKPDHKWGYCTTGHTLVYSFRVLISFHEHCVVFFKVGNGKKYINYVRKLVNYATSSDYCCLASKVDDKYVLALCDSIGTPIDSKFIELRPVFLTVTNTHVIAASQRAFYTWQFKNIPYYAGCTHGHHKCFERLTYMASGPSEAWSDEPSTAISRRTFDDAGDRICSICASDKFLIIGCESGTLNLYSMPEIFLLKKHSIKYSAQQLSLNSMSTRLSIIDFHGKLKIFAINEASLESGSTVDMGNLLSFEKSDVRHMRWSEDLHSRFVIMDKTKMCVYVDTNEVEASSNKGYICEFRGEQIRVARMNEIMEDPENPVTDFINYETAYQLVHV